jgi:enoyl-CoA hydratase
VNPLVSYNLAESIATITMNDGKVNALSLPMLAELNKAFDTAAADGAVVVLTGRAGMFSAGFDLALLRAGTADTLDMLAAGFALAERLLSFPRPIVAACSGHAIAMATFLLLSTDYRIGASGPYRITANEVAIGLTMPRAAVEICRQRLTPAHFHRAVSLAEVYEPAAAVEAGFLDQVVGPADLAEVAQACAARLATLDADAHAATKLRAREHTLTALRTAIGADNAELAKRGQ